MTPFPRPADNPRIRRVLSFDELVTTRFANGVNALCWPRKLPGDFAEIARLLAGPRGIVTLEEDDLAALPVSAGGRMAIDVMLEDQRQLRARGLDPVLDYIDGYLRDATDCPVPTDVFSWHVDSAPLEADTWLCTYHGRPSEGLRNEHAVRRIDVPETRAALLALHGGADDDSFREFLHENCFDLHYIPTSSAEPYSFGIGNLWRIADEYPGSPVPPCIHRAPGTPAGDPPRLLLIG
jgi:hypothetical protein